VDTHDAMVIFVFYKVTSLKTSSTAFHSKIYKATFFRELDPLVGHTHGEVTSLARLLSVADKLTKATNVVAVTAYEVTYVMYGWLQFVKMELCGTKEKKKPMCMDSEKSLKFHQMDPEITSTELWATWHENEGEHAEPV